MTDPVSYERLLARVDSIVEKQTDLTNQLGHLTRTLETRYLTRELYHEGRRADHQDLADLQRRLDTTDQNRARDRWLIITGLVFPAIVGLLLLYVATRIGGSPA